MVAEAFEGLGSESSFLGAPEETSSQLSTLDWQSSQRRKQLSANGCSCKGGTRGKKETCESVVREKRSVVLSRGSPPEARLAWGAEATAACEHPEGGMLPEGSESLPATPIACNEFMCSS